MPFDYNPDNASNCVTAGDYEATLTKVVDDAQSKAGDRMCVLFWKVYAGASEIELKDYIVDKPGALWKMRSLANAAGQYERFKAKQFQPAELVGQNFTVTLDIKDSPKYGEQNQISNYAPLNRASGGEAVKVSAPKGALTEEDIPF